MKTILTLSALILFVSFFSQNAHCQNGNLSALTFEPTTLIDIGIGADVCADTININGTFTGGGSICTGSMPVTMLSFNSTVRDNNVWLNWSTSVELNNSGFDVERRIAKSTGEWLKVSFVKGNGTTNTPMYFNYLDKNLKSGTYEYRLKQIDYNGNFEFHNLSLNAVVTAPALFSLSQNYPNPSNPKSKIDFQMPFDGKVSIRVYELSGREVVTLVDGFRTADFYSVEFDGSNLASGVYFYRINVSGQNKTFEATKKMVLVK